MSTLEEYKNEWGQKSKKTAAQQPFDQKTFGQLIKSRVKKHINASMKYFWASFALQILVYALLAHVIVKYWTDAGLLALSLTGILLYVPFTIMLMKKFKGMAVVRVEDNTEVSLQQYVRKYHDLLQGFYRFKKRYELFLIPLSSAIGVWLVFKLYVPGGVMAHQTGAMITLAITLISCALAIWSENRKSFEAPLLQLRQVMKEFEKDG